MRSLGVLTLIAALACVSTAQRADNNTDEQLRARNAPDLFVLSVTASGPGKSGRSTFNIDVQNMGAKTVTAIEWEYAPARSVGRYGADNPLKFRNDETGIRPDKKVKLSKQVDLYVSPLITQFRLNSVRIMRVEYDDGSHWQRPSGDR
jgi:hypothetical protein